MSLGEAPSVRVKSPLIVQGVVPVMSDEEPDVTVTVHVSAAVAKFDPVKVNESPTLAGFGVTVIFGTIVRVALAMSPQFPITCMPFVSTAEDLPEVLMMNEPVTDPPATEHEGLPSIVLSGPLTVQLVSEELKPEPVMRIVSPPLPVLGESNIEGPVTVKVSHRTPETETSCGSVSVTLYCSPIAACVEIVKLPVRRPIESALQLVTESKRGVGTVGTPPAEEGNVVISLLQLPIEPPYPEPEKATTVPAPPVFGVNENDDRTMNCVREESPNWPVPVIWYGPPKALDLTVNWHVPVMVPAEAVHLKGLGMPQRALAPPTSEVDVT